MSENSEEHHKYFPMKKFLLFTFMKKNGGKMSEIDIVNLYGKKIIIGKEPDRLTFGPVRANATVTFLDKLYKQEYLTFTGKKGEIRIWSLTPKAKQNYLYNKKRLEDEYEGVEGFVRYVNMRKEKNKLLKKEMSENEKNM